MSAARPPGEKWVSRRDLYHLAFILLLQAVEWLPAPGLLGALARLCGAAAFRLSRRKRRIIEKKLAGCFGQMPNGEKRLMVQGIFRETWRELFAWARLGRPGPPEGEVEVLGLEHVRRALGEGRGAILWESSGLGRRLQAKAILHASGLRVYQVHGPANLGGFDTDEGGHTFVQRRFVRPFFDHRESRVVAGLIYLPASNSLAYTRSLLACLNRNELLCIAGDGRLGNRRIRQSFLGGSKAFAPGMLSLARLSGAPILPMFCLKTTQARTTLRIEPPIFTPGSAGREADDAGLSRYAGLLEDLARHHPQQYRNWHILD
jgi:lauroyl/myristoyl acyltransferase